MSDNQNALMEVLKEAKGCFDAAEVEGLSNVLALQHGEDFLRLKDLVERRLMFAEAAIDNAIALASTAQSEEAELPPPPKPAGSVHDDGYWLQNKDGPLAELPRHVSRRSDFYTPEQMRSYALAARANLQRGHEGLRKVLKEGRRAIGDHFAPNDCYATGPLTGNAVRDLVECPACSFITMYDAAMKEQAK
jgi:hypothetical protein